MELKQGFEISLKNPEFLNEYPVEKKGYVVGIDTYKIGKYSTFFLYEIDSAGEVLYILKQHNTFGTKYGLFREMTKIGDRKDLIENSFEWIFEPFEPEDIRKIPLPNKYGYEFWDYNQLEYAQYLYIYNNTYRHLITFHGKNQDGKSSSITEWVADNKCHEPRIVIIENDEEDNQLILCLVGYDINESEINIYGT